MPWLRAQGAHVYVAPLPSTTTAWYGWPKSGAREVATHAFAGEVTGDLVLEAAQDVHEYIDCMKLTNGVRTVVTVEHPMGILRTFMCSGWVLVTTPAPGPEVMLVGGVIGYVSSTMSPMTINVSDVSAVSVYRGGMPPTPTTSLMSVCSEGVTACTFAFGDGGWTVLKARECNVTCVGDQCLMTQTTHAAESYMCVGPTMPTVLQQCVPPSGMGGMGDVWVGSVQCGAVCSVSCVGPACVAAVMNVSTASDVVCMHGVALNVTQPCMDDGPGLRSGAVSCVPSVCEVTCNGLTCDPNTTSVAGTTAAYTCTSGAVASVDWNGGCQFDGMVWRVNVTCPTACDVVCADGDACGTTQARANASAYECVGGASPTVVLACTDNGSGMFVGAVTCHPTMCVINCTGGVPCQFVRCGRQRR